MTAKTGFFACAAALSLMLAGAVQAAGSGAPTRITVTGSSTIAPLMSEVGKAYEKSNPSARVDVQTGGSSRGLMDVRKKTADIGMVSRALTDGEKDLQSVLLAKDGIGMIVNTANPVKSLTREQVIAIYSGKLKNWKDVGGPNLPITVISKAEGRSTLEVFSQYFGLSYRAIRAHVIIGDNQQEIMTVSSNKGAIGYVSIGSAEYEAKLGTPIRMVQLDQLQPSSENIAKGIYPVARELNLVFRAPLSKEAFELINFAQSPEASRYIAAQYFVPLAKPPLAKR
jgi:phosphate transport system substrate-binding protein